MNPLASGVRAGDRRALARALSLVDSEAPEGREILRDLGRPARPADVFGVTGAPGVGKSTLVDLLARALAARGRKVGVLAVDPSSPFSGGALLGDRIRMDDPDPDVFIRSLSSRGHAGGISRAVGAAIRLLEAFGKDLVIVETVGAGQSEVEIMAHADVTAVVLVPGLGDDIQANKAGILEIGDLFIVNKADRPGADRVVREIRMMLTLAPRGAGYPPILQTVATEGKGLGEVADAILTRLAAPEVASGRTARRRRNAEAEFREAVARRVVERIERTSPYLDAVRRIAESAADPEDLAETLVASWGKDGFPDEGGAGR